MNPPGIRIDVDGTISPLPDLSYESIKAGVGGWIEAAPTAASIVIYLDEEGKIKGLPLNPVANMLWALVDEFGCIADGDFLVGPVVVLGPYDDEGENTPLDADMLALINALAAEWEGAWS
jgi:hypothetical protein